MSDRRLVLVNITEVKRAIENNEAFARSVVQSQCGAVVLPLEAFVSGQIRKKINPLKQILQEHKIALEAGGWELSNMVPRRYFFFNKDSFRMEGGKRIKDHNFCPTSLDAIRIIGQEGKKLFEAAAGIEVFHLWPDKDAETAWCSCPTCRAFTFEEQCRIAINAAADVLATINPGASVTYYEKPTETCNINLRKNIIILLSLSENVSMENLAK